MQLALVVGRATATVRHKSLSRQKLLLVQPLAADGVSPDGFPLLAIDSVGAGANEQVMITSDGRGARETLGDETSPVRWSIVGIRDA
jgi:ethanolamine utilization protein EutN